ncbi:hypothetical protein CPC08DRAFT_768530 [Agrocybe pediades]|nr:hypothetical protein CPC08DRAFT_768530 [Agrocybe pediades]
MNDQPKQQQAKGKAKAKATEKAAKSPISLLEAPDGYCLGVTEGGTKYIVPRYLLEDIKSKDAAHRKRSQVIRERVEIGSGITEEGEPEESIGEVLLSFPPDPILSQFDLLQRHSEVMEMRQRHGISYKDACHRLYLAEMERVHAKQEAYYGFRDLEKRIIEALEEVSGSTTAQNNVGSGSSSRQSGAAAPLNNNVGAPPSGHNAHTQPHNARQDKK